MGESIRTNIGLLGSISRFPKYEIPPTNPAKVAGIVTACSRPMNMHQKCEKVTNIPFPISSCACVSSSNPATAKSPSLQVEPGLSSSFPDEARSLETEPRTALCALLAARVALAGRSTLLESRWRRTSSSGQVARRYDMDAFDDVNKRPWTAGAGRNLPEPAGEDPSLDLDRRLCTMLLAIAPSLAQAAHDGSRLRYPLALRPLPQQSIDWDITKDNCRECVHEGCRRHRRD